MARYQEKLGEDINLRKNRQSFHFSGMSTWEVIVLKVRKEMKIPG